MANLLGVIVTWITFPGVILHEWSHKTFCNIAGVPVYEVKYFTFGNPAGYVRHGEVTRYRDAFLVTIAPFIVNTIFALLAFVIPALHINDIVNIVFLWLGASFAMHAFPSNGDAKNLWNHSRQMWRSNPVALIGFPLVMIIAMANLLRIFWFDLVYAVTLYGVTFSTVTAVLIIGASVTGLYTVTTVTADQASSTNNMYNTPAASATSYPANSYIAGHTYTSTSNYVPGKEAPAKDWLPIAQDAMKSKSSDATLIMVKGSSDNGGVDLPINGKSHVWEYEYSSEAEDRLYDVSIRDGALDGVTTKKLSQSSVEKILYKYGDPTITSWNLDSTDAVRISNDKFDEMTGLDAPASASYALELNCWDRLAWTVYNYDSTTRVIADISIDPETGMIANAWQNPNA
ncbi:MAG TPA: DUF3267 domain-containing protein [Methanocella sp.]|nr:DUF3267 domain-containing protein [Methanocella sp.]